MTPEQFEVFYQQKRDFENSVVKDYSIIVTTCGCAAKALIRDLDIKTVIIDEATQVKEQDSFMATINAEQIILVGDQKQLSPTLEYQIKGPKSMYERLIMAGFDYCFLDTQYRMHEELLHVPNLLFYDNQIRNGYKTVEGKRFLGVECPFLFIDVSNGKEKLQGTSFTNIAEIDVLEQFTKLILERFRLDHS